MTNSIALGLAVAVVAALAADVFLNDAQASIFMGKEMLLLIEYLAFWR